MKKRDCIVCNKPISYSNWSKHTKTKKHLKNLEEYNNQPEPTSNQPNNTNLTPNNTNLTPNNTNLTPNNTNLTPNNTNTNKLQCSYCNKKFSRIDSKTRHINKNRCKVKKGI